MMVKMEVIDDMVVEEEFWSILEWNETPAEKKFSYAQNASK